LIDWLIDWLISIGVTRDMDTNKSAYYLSYELWKETICRKSYVISGGGSHPVAAAAVESGFFFLTAPVELTPGVAVNETIRPLSELLQEPVHHRICVR